MKTIFTVLFVFGKQKVASIGHKYDLNVKLICLHGKVWVIYLLHGVKVRETFLYGSIYSTKKSLLTDHVL